MLINENIGLSSTHILLVPYCSHHVPRYHEWMKDPLTNQRDSTSHGPMRKDIQIATASEPLSLAEEYGMQQSWRNDADKLTFISCLPLSSPQSPSSNGPKESNTQKNAITRRKIKPKEDDAPDRMLGDVNLFLKFSDDDEEENDDTRSGDLPSIVGEIEVMIAEKGKQNRGYGRASLLCLLMYIATHELDIVREFLRDRAQDAGPSQGTQKEEGQEQRHAREGKLAYLVVRIGATNERSLALFERLGFQRIRDEPNYFGELELRKRGLYENNMKGLMEQYGVERYREVMYNDDE